jgi:hypothetical protein
MAPFESKNQAMATKISDNGFFSHEAIRKGELIKQEHKQLFFYLAEVNEQAHRYLGLWRVSSTNVKQLFSAALFVRALTAYQALALLTQRATRPKRATCRNILEAKFKLAYLFKEPEAAVLLIAKGEKKRADRLRSMKTGERLFVSSPKRLHGCFGLGIGIESRTRCHFSGVLLLTKKGCSLLDHGQLLIIDFSLN